MYIKIPLFPIVNWDYFLFSVLTVSPNVNVFIRMVVLAVVLAERPSHFISQTSSIKI